VIKFVTYDKSVVFSGFSEFPLPIKLNAMKVDVPEILLKMALNTIILISNGQMMDQHFVYVVH
jgi:hypothetical protein